MNFEKYPLTPIYDSEIPHQGPICRASEITGNVVDIQRSDAAGAGVITVEFDTKDDRFVQAGEFPVMVFAFTGPKTFRFQWRNARNFARTAVSMREANETLAAFAGCFLRIPQAGGVPSIWVRGTGVAIEEVQS